MVSGTEMKTDRIICRRPEDNDAVWQDLKLHQWVFVKLVKFVMTPRVFWWRWRKATLLCPKGSAKAVGSVQQTSPDVTSRVWMTEPHPLIDSWSQRAQLDQRAKGYIKAKFLPDAFLFLKESQYIYNAFNLLLKSVTEPLDLSECPGAVKGHFLFWCLKKILTSTWFGFHRWH